MKRLRTLILFWPSFALSMLLKVEISSPIITPIAERFANSGLVPPPAKGPAQYGLLGTYLREGDEEEAGQMARKIWRQVELASRESATGHAADLNRVGALGSIVELYAASEVPLPTWLTDVLEAFLERLDRPDLKWEPGEELEAGKAEEIIDVIKREEI